MSNQRTAFDSFARWHTIGTLALTANQLRKNRQTQKQARDTQGRYVTTGRSAVPTGGEVPPPPSMDDCYSIDVVAAREQGWGSGDYVDGELVGVGDGDWTEEELAGWEQVY